MSSHDPPPAATPSPSRGGRLRRLTRRLAARPRREIAALAAVVALAAVLAAVVHGLLPGRIQYLPVAYAYSGLIECLSEGELLRPPVCESLGVPLGFVPLTDGPYLVAASAVRRLTGTAPLTAKRLTDAAILTLSFLSLIVLQRRMGIERAVAVPVAVLYLFLPILLGHVGIWSFFVGILLLPAYLLVEHACFSALAAGAERPGWARVTLVGAGYAAARTLSLFQDPYTAVMMVAVSAVILVVVAGSCLVRRRFATAAILAVTWAASVAVAVGLYKSWVPGGADYMVMPIDFFRAQGVDLISLVVPSGRLWWSDLLDVGVHRWSATAYWGDGTNVSHNYLGFTLLLPLAVYGIRRLRRGRRPAAGWTGARFWPALALAAGVCLLISFGPSLKLNDTREAVRQERFGYDDYFMPPEAATLTLPTERLFVTLPGLKHMRVPYRWIVIPKLVLLLGFAWVASRVYRRHRLAGLALVVLALVEHLPDLHDLDRNGTERYDEYRRFNREVLAEMGRFLVPGERVFFLSGANDYLVNYLGPRLDVASYNVGGDKNYVLSEERWPESLVKLRRGLPFIQRLAPRITGVLLSGDVDAVVVPYFDLRWHSYTWPPSPAERFERRLPIRREFDPPPPPLRLAESWWFAVLSLDDERSRAAAGGALIADPNPIVICDGARFGHTTLSWNVPTPAVEIRLEAPDGRLFAEGGATGSATTGPWVRDGMEFYLQDVTKERPLTPERTLARLTVRVSRDCP